MNKKSVNLLNNKKYISISEFIEENHKLLTSLGVLFTLIIFSQSLKIKIFIHILTFILFGMTLIVIGEINKKFPKDKDSSHILGVFQILIYSVFIILASYWVLLYRELFPFILGYISYFIAIKYLVYPLSLKFTEITIKKFHKKLGYKAIGIFYMLSALVIVGGFYLIYTLIDSWLHITNLLDLIYSFINKK